VGKVALLCAVLIVGLGFPAAWLIYRNPWRLSRGKAAVIRLLSRYPELEPADVVELDKTELARREAVHGEKIERAVLLTVRIRAPYDADVLGFMRALRQDPSVKEHFERFIFESRGCTWYLGGEPWEVSWLLLPRAPESSSRFSIFGVRFSL